MVVICSLNELPPKLSSLKQEDLYLKFLSIGNMGMAQQGLSPQATIKVWRETAIISWTTREGCATMLHWNTAVGRIQFCVGVRASILHWPLTRVSCYMGLSIEKLIIWQLSSSKQASKKRRRLRQDRGREKGLEQKQE